MQKRKMLREFYLEQEARQVSTPLEKRDTIVSYLLPKTYPKDIALLWIREVPADEICLSLKRDNEFCKRYNVYNLDGGILVFEILTP